MAWLNSDQEPDWNLGDTPDFKAGKRCTVFNVPIVTEILPGMFRYGRSPEGKRWSNRLSVVYGYVPGVTGADNEDLDVIIVPGKLWVDTVWVVYQMHSDGSFDEHKCVFNCSHEDDARHAYCSLFSDNSGEGRIMKIQEMSLDDFRHWMSGDDEKNSVATTVGPVRRLDATAPAAAEIIEGDPTVDDPSAARDGTSQEEVDVDNNGEAVVEEPKLDRTSLLLVTIPRIPKAPHITITKCPTTGGSQVMCYILSSFSYDNWAGYLEYIIQLLYLADERDVFTFAINSPGGEVDVAARLASAIRETKALVKTIAIGQVASCGCLIWAEGKERFVTPGAHLMQHMSSHAAMGHSFSIIQDGVALVKYIRDVVFRRAIEIGLLTPEETTEMITKKRDIILTPRQVCERTGAVLLEKW